jgi:hypothetical protein
LVIDQHQVHLDPVSEAVTLQDAESKHGIRNTSLEFPFDALRLT